MPKRLTYLFIVCLTAGVIYSFGCGGGDGGGDQPPPPPQTIDKVVWAQEVPLDFELAVPPQATEGEEGKSAKAVQQKSFYTEEEKEQGKTVAFFVSDPNGSNAARLTPKKMSAVQLGNDLAPNGDLWFATKAGIFVTNVSDPKPRAILSLQELATKFSDGTEAGLYYPQDIFDALNKHDIKDSNIIFYSKNDGTGNYVAIISTQIKYIKSAQGGENEKAANLTLRYDSSTGEIGFILPFMSATNDAGGNIAFGSGENAGTANILLGPGNPAMDKLIYYLTMTSKGAAKTYYITYDPITNKHVTFDLPWYFDPKLDSQTFWYYKANGCVIYQEGVEIPFKVEDCKVTYTTENEIDVRKKVAACMQNAINGKLIGLMCAPSHDVTDFVSSKDKLAGFLTLTSAGTPKKLMDIDAGIVKQFEYRPESEDVAVSDVSCPKKAGYCEPYSNVVNATPEKKQKIYLEPKKIKAGMADYPTLLVLGVTKDGNEFRNALYLLNPATGEFKLIDKEDSKTAIITSAITSAGLNSPKATKTSDGILFIYAKRPKDNYSGPTSSFNAYFAYDPSWPAPIAMTKYVPNMTEAVDFVDFADGKKIDSHVVTYDRKYAFLKAQDDMLKTNTYMLDLTKIFPQKIAAGEEPKTAEAEGETSSEGTTPATTQAINPFGKNAKMVNPVLQSQNISDTLRAKLGDKLIWTSDQDGFERLYWNTIENPAFNRFTTQDVENKEEVVGFAQNIPPFVMPSFAVPLDISADIATELACGKGAAHATYCGTDARLMCLNGKCVDMYSCSADAPKGACYKGTDKCENGVCVASGVLSCDPPCLVGTCIDGVCSKIGGCAPECDEGQKCENGKCVPPCTPSCAGKECGDNGCNGSCGACMEGKNCDAAQGKCVAKAAGSCTADADCGAGFICGSAKMCLPVMTGVVTLKQMSMAYAVDTVDFYVYAEWVQVKDFSGQQIQKYFYKVDDKVVEEAAGKSKKFKILMSGGDSTKTSNVSVWPNIDGLTDSDIAKIKITSQIPLTNTEHCNLTTPNTTKCQSGFKCNNNNLCICTPPCACVPSCQGKVCGLDGCEGICGKCPPGQACNASGACVNK